MGPGSALEGSEPLGQMIVSRFQGSHSLFRALAPPNLPMPFVAELMLAERTRHEAAHDQHCGGFRPPT